MFVNILFLAILYQSLQIITKCNMMTDFDSKPLRILHDFDGVPVTLTIVVDDN